MKSKKAFTLVEIIVCIVLIALIATVSFISLKSKDDDLDNYEKEVDNAVSVISDKLESDNTLNSFIETDASSTSSITSYYCLKKETLISEGILTEDNEIIKKLKSNEYIYVVKDGVGNYTIDYNVSSDKCRYYIANIESISGDAGNEFTGGTEDDSYALKEEFNKVDDNRYQMKLTFTKDVYNEEISPLYVLFVLDTSGSMSWNDSSGLAKKSIKNFGEDILNNITNSKIGFLPFANSAYPKYFGDSYWTTDVSTFKSSVDTVKYTGSNYYNLAYNSITEDYKISSLEDNAMIYIVMFSDAGNGPTCYTTTNENLVVNNIAPNVNRIIFIAYNPGDATCLLNISNAVNRKYSDLSTHIYSNNSDVDKVLEGVSNKVKEETQYKNVKISLQVDKEYFSVIVDNTWSLDSSSNTISKTIDFSSLEIDVLETELFFDIVYNAKTDINSYSDEIAIIKSFVLEFEKKDGTIEKVNIDTSQLPVTKISTTEKSVIN